MLCNQCNRYLDAYEEGSLTDTLRRAVETHLATCETCREEARSIRRLLGLLRDAAEITPPVDFAASVLVNIVGNIDLAQVGKIGEIAGVDFELPDLDPTKERPTEEQRGQMQRHREGALESLRQGRVEDAVAEMKQVPMLHGNLPQDYAFLALLHQMLGEQDAAYYYLGRTYEAQQDRDFARELYHQAKQINPDNPLLEAF